MSDFEPGKREHRGQLRRRERARATRHPSRSASRRRTDRIRVRNTSKSASVINSSVRDAEGAWCACRLHVLERPVGAKVDDLGWPVMTADETDTTPTDAETTPTDAETTERDPADRRALRGAGAAVHRPAVRRGPAHDEEPRRRARPRAGDVRQGVRRIRAVHAGHEPQGVAVPHPHEHLHQQLPQEAARALSGHDRRARGLAARRRRVDDGAGRVARPRPRPSTTCPTAR